MERHLKRSHRDIDSSVWEREGDESHSGKQALYDDFGSELAEEILWGKKTECRVSSPKSGYSQSLLEKEEMLQVNGPPSCSPERQYGEPSPVPALPLNSPSPFLPQDSQLGGCQQAELRANHTNVSAEMPQGKQKRRKCSRSLGIERDDHIECYPRGKALPRSNQDGLCLSYSAKREGKEKRWTWLCGSLL